MLARVGTLTLPTPVAVAGGAFFVLAGVLVGTALNHGAAENATAKVVSFDAEQARLCLGGDALSGDADAAGELCGTWRHTPNQTEPTPGDTFRFVTVRTSGHQAGQDRHATVIYGDVVS